MPELSNPLYARKNVVPLLPNATGTIDDELLFNAAPFGAFDAQLAPPANATLSRFLYISSTPSLARRATTATVVGIDILSLLPMGKSLACVCDRVHGAAAIASILTLTCQADPC
jgi:hypothetical protein